MDLITSALVMKWRIEVGSIEPSQLSAILADLEARIRALPQPLNLQARIEFRFLPTMEGANAGQPWQALWITASSVVCEYGWTLEDAAAHIVDRLDHPERYPDSDSD
jgi:hypothetical protein